VTSSLTRSVESGTALARFAGALADETRATMCLALLDGRAWTAGELAACCGVAPSTATEHLDRLLAAGLLVQHRQGRHRYVQLAGPQVAALLEDLTAHLDTPPPVRSLRAATASAALTRARTCYDHLAGRLGVAVTDAMTHAGLVSQAGGVAVTDAGIAWLTGTLGVDPAALTATRRPLARACVDWTERRPHLAGTAGARLCERFLANGWIAPHRRVSRSVLVTPDGEAALRDLLGIDVERALAAGEAGSSAVR
jgi:DNA-binding transcriptional ArsR family regulator